MSGGFHPLNNPSMPFCAEGSGKGFTTINNAHKTVCTSAKRLYYAANIGQEIYATALEKKFLYTGPRWMEL